MNGCKIIITGNPRPEILIIIAAAFYQMGNKAIGYALPSEGDFMRGKKGLLPNQAPVKSFIKNNNMLVLQSA